jgi:hypothetical protein
MLIEHPWVLGDTTWPVVRDTAYRVAVLPWGATEAKGEEFFAAVTRQIAGSLIELAAADLAAMYGD